MQFCSFLKICRKYLNGVEVGLMLKENFDWSGTVQIGIEVMF
jgi:hypothetical protein